MTTADRERKLTRAKATIADRLRTVRGERSQRRFARDLGVFQQNINRYEAGTCPHIDFVLTLAYAERISPTWLLLGIGPMRTTFHGPTPGKRKR